MISQLFPITNSLLFLFLAGLHFYWAFGGQWAAKIVIPQHQNRPVFQPGIFATTIVALGLLSFAAIHLLILFMHSNNLLKWIILSIAAIFLLRSIGDFRFVGLFKSIKNTSFAKMDSQYYTPLCIIISLNSLLTFLKL